MTAEELNDIAIDLYIHSRFVEAAAVAKEALSISENEQIQRLRAWKILGNIALSGSNYTQALDFYGNALAICEFLNDNSNAAKITMGIGDVYRGIFNFTKALNYYEKALSLHEELGDKRGTANTIGNMGIMYKDLCSNDKALECYTKALAIHEELGDESGAARVTGNIGNVYSNLEMYDKALEYYTKALAIHEELGDESGAARVTGNIGAIYTVLCTPDKAFEYLQKALTAHEELGEKALVAMVTGNIGTVYYNNCIYDKALENYSKALAIYEVIGDKHGVAINTGNIGGVYAKVGFEGHDLLKAEKYMLKELDILEELGTKKSLCGTHKALAELYKSQKRWQDALQHFEKFHDLEKEVKSEEATKQAQQMEHRRKIEEAERDRQLKIARHEVTMSLLHKTLPPSIAERLMDGEKNIADKFESVSILFADIVGFTPLSARTEPKRMVELLNNLFTRFDKLTIEYNVERIKTIGDAYMVVSGAPEQCEDHAERLARFAIAMLEETEKFAEEVGEDIRMRVGINTGEAIGAVVGETKFSYDLWSDAVNTASRMESHGEPGKIHCTEDFVNALGNTEFPIIERGEMDIKGKGLMKTYFLEKV
ncbi:MAG: tetratricopeptide repeat protein [Bacteroidetes bacterium]|nr:tetratricopeptide repeat protein [Bacteroidota bacterium]